MNSSNKKRKCNLKFLVELFLITLFCMSFVYAADQDFNLIVNLDDVEIVSVIPFSYNDFYQKDLYFGGSVDEVEYFEGVEEDTPKSIVDSSLITKLDSGVSSQKIIPKFLSNSFIYYSDLDINVNQVSDYNLELELNKREYKIDLCNNDGQCDVCLDGICDVVENYFTCPSDCNSGNEDGYCDIELDGICDLDCMSYDFDCDDCVNKDCIYKDQNKNDNQILCNDLGGMECSLGMICKGYFTYTYDYGSRCCVGECGLDIQFDSVFDKDNEIDFKAEEERAYAEYINEQEQGRFDVITLILIFGIIVMLVLCVVFVGIFEVRRVKREHQIRNYVFGLYKQGYQYDQVYMSLRNQNVEEELIKKVMKIYDQKK